MCPDPGDARSYNNARKTELLPNRTPTLTNWTPPVPGHSIRKEKMKMATMMIEEDQKRYQKVQE